MAIRFMFPVLHGDQETYTLQTIFGKGIQKLLGGSFRSYPSTLAKAPQVISKRDAGICSHGKDILEMKLLKVGNLGQIARGAARMFPKNLTYSSAGDGCTVHVGSRNRS